MNRWCAALPLFAALLSHAGLLGAQSAAERATLDAVRDTITRTSDPDSLQALRRAGPRGALGLVRGCFISLRLGELGRGRGPFDQAADQCERAIRAETSWPYPWYGLGLTRLAMWSRRFITKESRQQVMGATYRQGAMTAFRRGIEVDPDFLPAGEALAGIITAIGTRRMPEDLLPALAVAARAPGASQEISLAITRLEFLGGRYDRALTAIVEYRERGGDPGMAGLEEARCLAALDRGDEAVVAYLEGLPLAGEDGRAAYRADLAWIAGHDEMARFDSLPPEDVQGFILRFWRGRELLAMRAPNERLREHLRRWVYIHQHYLLEKPDDVPNFAAGFDELDERGVGDDVLPMDIMTEVAFGIPRTATYKRDQWEVDDRGVIYIRHGTPSREVFGPGVANASWYYFLPEGDRVYHFLGSKALGRHAPTTLTAALPLNPAMLAARGDVDPRFMLLAMRIENLAAQSETDRGLAVVSGGEYAGSPYGARIPAPWLQREVLKNREAIAAAVVTDGFPLRFTKSLSAIVQLYGVMFAPEERPRLLAVFAIPARELTPQPRTDGQPGVLYSVAMRLVALDRTTGTVVRMDTTRVFAAPDTLKGQQHLTGLLETTIPPGMYQVRLLLSAPTTDAGVGGGRDSLLIPASPRDLVISDLLLGREGSGLSWRGPEGLVPLNPLNAFPRDAVAELSYEMAGLVPGTDYRVTMALRGADDKAQDPPKVQVAFDLTATSTHERVRRSLDLANLKPDGYFLVVTVSERLSGHTVRRVAALNVVK